MEIRKEATANAHGVDEAFVEGEVPTHANSIKKPAPELPSELNSPCNIGDASC